MGIFSRLTDIINSNLNAMLDRAEDPEKMIRLVIQEMEDTLVEVRSSTVKVLAEKKELERRIADLHRERDEWQRKAEVALAKNREDLAKGALMAKSKAAEAADALGRELVQLDAAVAKSGDDIAKLQAKLNDAKTREKALTQRHKTAADRVKVRAKLHDGRIDDALSRFEMVERNLDELEGRVEVYDLGHRKSLTEEIAELEANDRIERELAELKARLGGGKPGGAA